MSTPVDLGQLVSAELIEGEDPEETALLRSAAADARAFLTGFRWCGAIRESYFGLGVGGVVSVFLFKIEPREPDVDEWLWVVVGDVPPAYLVVDDAPSPIAALKVYVDEMSRWASSAKLGQPVEGLIPVNVPPTPENAERLEKRLDFLRSEILPRFEAG